MDLEKNVMSYAGAGHPPLLLWRKSSGSAAEVLENGLVLGQFPEATYDVVQVALEPGDRSIIYTDGILETKNLSDEEFGTGRFMRLMETSHGIGANQFVDALLEELSQWSEHPRGEGQQDDITVLVIDFKSHRQPAKP
jgi:serine phosphatase RsbU (regulator of sigma subunit)